MLAAMTLAARLAVLACCLVLPACGSDDDAPPVATPTATGVPTATATPTVNPLAQACLDDGGTVSRGSCCAGAQDFPRTCGLGACGCAPTDSRELPLCDCPTTRCWNGSHCVVR